MSPHRPFAARSKRWASQRFLLHIFTIISKLSCSSEYGQELHVTEQNIYQHQIDQNTFNNEAKVQTPKQAAEQYTQY